MPKIVVVYLSTSGNTKKMADAIVEGAQSRNVDAVAMNFHEAKIEELKSADAIALGSSTFHIRCCRPWKNLLKVSVNSMQKARSVELLAPMDGAERLPVWSRKRCVNLV